MNEKCNVNFWYNTREKVLHVEINRLKLEFDPEAMIMDFVKKTKVNLNDLTFIDYQTAIVEILPSKYYKKLFLDSGIFERCNNFGIHK